MSNDIKDCSNGYDTIAPQFVANRNLTIGVTTVLNWARSLRLGASILDLGCGHGIPISAALMDDGFIVYGIDASQNLVAEFKRQFPHAKVACEPAEDSRFFNSMFDGIIAIGLIFLLTAEAQQKLILRVAPALKPGGQFLFTAPKQCATWTDTLTGRKSYSLGNEVYREILSKAGLQRVDEYIDEGENHYYAYAR